MIRPARRSIDEKTVAIGLTRAGFCRNLFACRAGAQPWTTAADYRLHHCRACPKDDPSPLLPFDELGTRIEHGHRTGDPAAFGGNH